MSEIIEQGNDALHAYTPLLPAVKSSQPRSMTVLYIVL